MLVLRFIRGRCYACRFADAVTIKEAREIMRRGEAVFLPYNEATGEFAAKPSSGRRIRR